MPFKTPYSTINRLNRIKLTNNSPSETTTPKKAKNKASTENQAQYTSETSLVAQILNYFHYSDRYVLDRHPSGKVMISKGGRLYWMNLAKKGTPDITGFDKVTGYHIGIECKIGKNKLMPEQAEHAKVLRESEHGIYILARDITDVLKVLEPREDLPF